MTSKDIKIDLNTDHRTGKIPNESVIQIALIKNCISEITNNINATTGLANNTDGDAPLLQSGENVYFVDGTRGAGKTTFMRSLREELEKDEDSKIYPLELIDPTKFETPMGILVSVISLLNSAVEKKRKNSFSWGNENKDYDEWQDVLNKLAKGIKSYAKKDSKIDSIDDVLRLSKGIDYSFSSLTLSQQCHELFDKAAKIINCKAFLLTFDDVDTNFAAGWEVLETIRCQLTSARIVTLITGDLQLYTHLVRGKQFGNFDKCLFKHDSKRQGERELMVDHLEQQYLLKIFPVENRFRLRTLGQLIQNDDHKIYIKSFCGKEDYLVSVITNLISDGLNLKSSNNEYIDEYLNYLLQSPIRQNLQLITRYNNDLVKEGNLLKTDSDDEVRAKLNNINKPNILNSTLNALMVSCLYKAGIDNVELTKLNLSYISSEVFNYSHIYGDVNASFYLRPNSNKEYLCNISITLAAAVAANLKGSISNCLRYMLVALGSVSLFDTISNIKENKVISNDKEQFKILFKSYMGIGRNESLSNWSSHAHACLSSTKVKVVYPGVLQLNKNARSHYLYNVKSSEDGYAVFKYKQNETNLAYLSAASSSSESVSTKKCNFFSIFSLISAIDELMNVVNDSDDFDVKHFIKPMTVKTASIPTWSGDVLPDTTEDEEDEAEDDEKNKLVEDASITDDIKEWFSAWHKNLGNLNDKTTPSALLIGKIWERLNSNLAEIARQHRSRLAKDKAGNVTKANGNAALIMRYKVIALLNAVLFEEDKYHKNEKENSLFNDLGSLTNSVTSSKEFSNKIKKIIDNNLLDRNLEALSIRYPIFVSLATCPLIIPFIFAKNSCYDIVDEIRYNRRINYFFISMSSSFNPKFKPVVEEVAEILEEKNKLAEVEKTKTSVKQKALNVKEENVMDDAINKVQDEYGFQTLYKSYVADVKKGKNTDPIYKTDVQDVVEASSVIEENTASK
ncbi:hypothetical protein H4J62_08515 [Colwellia sp. BRX8-5]|nr:MULTISPECIES: hypothetical protein [unclassified Colwellia]MBA6362020.1 hypothetical protein [Colwellia sp. BRX8-6]MBA6367561.1 hypothetical protein [Colwellia sp. BRX8-5]